MLPAPYVDPRADRRVAEVGEVVRFGTGIQRRVLHLDEVADVHVDAEVGAGPQPRIRADAGIGADDRAVDVRERMDHRAGRDGRVADHAMRADHDAVAERDAAFEDAADVDLHVAAAHQLAALVEPRRVRQAHAGVHQRLGAPALQAPLELGELRRAVDAEHFGFVGRRHGHHRHAVCHSERNDIGQVVLVLGVVVGQLLEPAFEVARRRGHHAGVDLADESLRLGRILVLDDRAHLFAVAHDAAVAGGVGELDRQQCQAFAAARGDERTFGRRRHERRVAVQDQRHAALVVVDERRRGLLHRMPGAELGFLPHEAQVFRQRLDGGLAPRRRHGRRR